MKALVWHGDQRLRFEDVPDPVPADGEIVVDIEVAGICGSDLHGYRGHPGPRVPPLVLGHELVGTAEGSRYAIYPLISCGHCPRCLDGEDNLCAEWRLIGMHRPGAFAERIAVPRSALVAVPGGMALERAVLAEPMACCIGALRGSGVAAEVSVVVFGCGPIGLLTVYLAARSGATVTVVDPVQERRAVAEKLGAAVGYPTPGEVAPASMSIAVDAAGFEQTWRGAIASVENGGRIVVVGLGETEGGFPMAHVVRRSITVRGQFGYSRTDFSDALEVLARGDLPIDWLTVSQMSRGAEAFAHLVNEPARFSKILLTPAAR